MADVTKASGSSDTSSNESTSNINLIENHKNSDKVPEKTTVDFSSILNREDSSIKVCKNPLRPSFLNPCVVFGGSSHFSANPSRNHFTLRSSSFNPAKTPEKASGSKPVLLRPSQLSSTTNVTNTDNSTKCTNPFVLSPPKLQSVYNPFTSAKPLGEEVTKSEPTRQDSENQPLVPVSSSNNSQEITVGSNISETAVSSSTPVRTGPVSFMPLGITGSSTPSNPAAPASGAAVSGFVFGQNLHERVDAPAAEVSREEGELHEATVSDASACDEAIARTNGATSEMLFTSVLQRELPDRNSDSGGEEKERKSLSEAAREYEESRAVKRKYEEVAVVTGEEEEVNVLQMNCKLFAFDNASSTWMERGRGTLRVNDLPFGSKTQSRVVMRTAGSLRVVLNTKIWAGMSVDRPSEKSVRLTAMDPTGQIKVFLVMAGGKEIDQLHKTLDWRVTNQKKQVTTVGGDSAMDKN